MSSGQHIYIGPMIHLYPNQAQPPRVDLAAHHDPAFEDRLFMPSNAYILPNAFDCGQIQWDYYTSDDAPFSAPIPIPSPDTQAKALAIFRAHPAVMAYTAELDDRNIPYRIAHQIVGYYY